MNQSRRNKTQFIRFIKTVAISHTIMPFYKFTEIIWLNWVLFAKAHVLYAVARHLILPCQVTDGYWWNFYMSIAALSLYKWLNLCTGRHTFSKSRHRVAVDIKTRASVVKVVNYVFFHVIN